MVQVDKRGRVRALSVLDRYFSLAVHLGLVGVVVIFLAAVTLSHNADDGANIGAGFGYLLLSALGMPWSMSAFVGPDGFFMAVAILLSVGANLGLHLALLRRRYAKRASLAA